MAKISFNSDNKKTNFSDFPKLFLDFQEKARIVCIEPEPEVNFVHTLRAPSIINGEVVMESVKNKDGSFTEKPKMDFVGKHLCFGNLNTLMEKDKDPANCPTCAAAQESDAIGPATRRFAMHVVQYKVKPGTFTPQTPFQAELVVWAFTDQRFSNLTDIAEEHGDLRQRDLLLGPCENKGFQKFDVNVGGSAAWMETDENKKFVAALYAENKLEDLDPAIGRKITKSQAEEDIQKVLLKHAQAFGGGSASEGPREAAGVAPSMDLEGLLGAPASTPVADPVSEPLEAPEAPLADFPATPAAEAEPTEEKPKSVLDFDSLLADL